MSPAFGLAVRAAYLSAITCSPLFLVFFLVELGLPPVFSVASLIWAVAIVSIVIIIYGISALGAWLRIWRGQRMLPDEYLRMRPWTAGLVALASVLGSLSALLSFYAVLGAGERFGHGTSSLPVNATLLMFAIALPLGELALLRQLGAQAP